MKKVILVLAVTVFLVACDNNKVYDVSFYKSNPDKAQETLNKCESGKLTGENCINAKSGLSRYNAQKFMDQMNGKK